MIFIDCEATGLDSKVNGIVQLALLVENNKGKIVDEINLEIRPFKGCVIDKKASDINGYTSERIETLQSEKKAVKQLVEFLDKNSKHNDKILCGYNSQFDVKFLYNLCERNDINFWDYFTFKDVDVYALVKILNIKGKDGSQKLTSICDLMGVDLANAHDALADIKATRKLYKVLVKTYLK